MMKISKVGLDLIKSFEGCRLQAYQCSAGVWTIGYGHTRGVKAGDKITQTKAEEFLKEDLARFETHVNTVNNQFRYEFNQNEYDALVSFAFNIGNINGLTMNGQRNKFQIAYNMTSYVYAAGKKLNGLVRRREAEKALFLKECDDAKPASVNTGTTYIVGMVYTTQVDSLVVRKAPYATAARVGYKNLTKSAQQHDRDKNGSLDKGTEVTCKGISKDTSGNTWMKIPSGYIAAIYKGEVFIK